MRASHDKGGTSMSKKSKAAGDADKIHEVKQTAEQEPAVSSALFVGRTLISVNQSLPPVQRKPTFFHFQMSLPKQKKRLKQTIMQTLPGQVTPLPKTKRLLLNQPLRLLPNNQTV